MRALVLLVFLPTLALADESADFYRGTDLERAGKDSEAAAVFRTLVERAPDDAFADDALFELARLEEEKLGDPVAAARDYGRLSRSYPQSRLAVRAARRAEELALTLGPGDKAAPAAAEWGKIFYGFAGRPRAETVKLLEDFLLRNPDFPDRAHATYFLGTLLRDEGRSADALARLRSVTAGDWGQRARRAEGDVLIATGDLVAAEAAFRAAGDDEGLGRVAVERWRARSMVLAWLLVAAAVLAGLVTVWRQARSFRPLLRPPAELLYLLPVALLFAASALTENAFLGHAIEIICVGGLIAAWLSGAALDAARANGNVTLRRALGHAAFAGIGVLSLAYIAVTRERLVDQLVETIRFGVDR